MIFIFITTFTMFTFTFFSHKVKIKFKTIPIIAHKAIPDNVICPKLILKPPIPTTKILPHK